jgi:DNA-binding transcriptional regulator LsrR (DeoR family)
MTGQEIADVLGITRQCVSNTLKSAFRKMFWYVRPKCQSDIEAVYVILKYLDVLYDEDQIKKVFRLFPKDIREKVINGGHHGMAL